MFCKAPFTYLMGSLMNNISFKYIYICAITHFRNMSKHKNE